MKPRFLFIFIFIASAALSFFGFTGELKAAEVITLGQYLNQVDHLNENFRAHLLQMKAFQNRAAEGSLEFMPQLTANFTYLDDKRITAAPAFLGTETISETAGLGVQTKLRTGTAINFGYNLASNTVYNSIETLPVPYYTAAPSLSISQSLWRDFNAAISKANETAIQADYLRQGLQELYSAQQLNFAAETAYWKLSLYRQMVALDKDAIDRTEKILVNNKRRVSMNVADRSDLLQSEAALQGKKLQYQTDLESLREIASQFNSLRNLKGDSVPEEVQPIETFIQKDMNKDLKRISDRVDILMAKAAAQNQKALYNLNTQKQKPDIVVSGAVQFNGLSSNINYSTGESFNADNPTYSASLKIIIPLDRGIINRIDEGYAASNQAMELRAQRAQFDLDQDWIDLQKKFKDAVERFQMARELEDLQSTKVQHERIRFTTGRTTAFQVLQFEEDYSAAQLARLRIANDLITFRAQARMYNGESL